MKQILLLGLFLLTSCGKDATTSCAGSHNGTWGAGAVEVVLADSCAFSYKDASCSSTGTYAAAPTLGSGAMQVNIASTTGSGCLAPGAHVCNYTWDNTNLGIACQ